MASPRKRQQIHAYLRRHQIHFAMLQETHLAKSSLEYTKVKWKGQLYGTTFSTYARGVAIWIAPGVPYVTSRVQCDPNGRYVLLEGALDGEPMALASIYTPNSNQWEFLRTLNSNKLNDPEMDTIWGGDFNCVLDTHRDRSIPPLDNTLAKRASLELAEWSSNNRLREIWRTGHPTHREYSFYSPVHKLYTRIDMIFASNDIIPKITTSGYLARTISYHNPLQATLRMGCTHTCIPTWRLQPDALIDPPYHAELAKCLSDYFALNKNTTTARTTEWDAHKVVIRGHCLAASLGVKRMLNRELLEIESKMRKVETEATTSVTSLETLNSLKSDYKEADARLSRHDYRHFKAPQHAEGNRSGKLLAWLVRQPLQSSPIGAIRTHSGEVINAQAGINKSFHTYYRSLYQPTNPPNEQQLSELLSLILQNINIIDSAATLDGPITSEELRLALSQKARGKTPGSDGLPMEYYSSLSAHLLQPLIEVFNEARNRKQLPDSMREALIVVLPKPGRDPLDVKSYRPLSLLNTDCKLLGKILANRLLPYLSDLIHHDQSGFVPGRNTFLNIRRLIRILHSTTETEAVAVALDIEKAFDTLGWEYLIRTLKAFGFQNGFINWIATLYAKPTARVKKGQMISEAFPIAGQADGASENPTYTILFPYTRMML
ncbi:hypothetical protein NDU88_007074 [Pleurodeles waltl]|uniref:Reverse transcriptase domain-containing protein n=1 Tax=Pleurodeles waltl TaxID=8319 RepID=A0AAV7NS66_PLEWA|nr:hypothetical protein NDU88_007074 [Pleurodeles waltl]